MKKLNVIEITKKLISYNTINPPGNEEKVARYLGSILKSHGFDIDYPIHAQGRLNLIATKSLDVNHAPIVLTGHLDVVPLGTIHWKVHPFKSVIKDEKLYGRGSSDMKAGVAAMMIAAIETCEDNPPKGGVKLMFTADEELGCHGANKLYTSGYDIGSASAIIVGEPTSNAPYIGHKGGLYISAKTYGKTAHSSMTHLGDNAIYKSARAISKIEQLKFEVQSDNLLGMPTVNVGKIKGGLNLNSVPDYSEFTIDVRSTTQLKNEAALKLLKNMLGKEVDLETMVDLNAISTSEKDPFIKMVFEITKVNMHTIGIIKAATFLTDAAILKPWLNNAPTVILGPGEPEMAHQTNEYCFVDKIYEAVDIYKSIIRQNNFS